MRSQERDSTREAGETLGEETGGGPQGSAAAAGMSAIVGVTIGMTVAGLEVRFGDVFADPGSSRGVVLCGTLTVLAIGVRAPQRFAMWLCAIAWQRFLARRDAWDLSADFRGRE